MSFAEKMAVIGPRYLARQAQRIADITPVLDRIDAYDGNELTDLRIVFHDIAGTAGSVGYPEIGDMAREADGIILSVQRSNSPLTADMVRRLRSLAADMAQTIAAARSE